MSVGMAFDYFKKMDIAIIEVGIGRLDATNHHR
jgi:folylpolyglutamate synthase/dihydropteroate synthase